MNLFKDLRVQFGQESVHQLRQLEHRQKKIARYRNHIVFDLRCRDESVTPPSLSLHVPVPSARAREITRKAEKQLLRERLRVNNNKLQQLQKDQENDRNDLFTRLPSTEKDQYRT